MQIKWASQAYKTRSPQLLGQECINAFVEPTPKDGKTEYAVYGNPGLALFSRMGNGPIRGFHVMANNLYIVSGSQLFEITQSAVQEAAQGTTVPATLIGSTNLGDLVSMADNGLQLVMVDGNVGWIYQPGGLNLVTTATAVAGATTIPTNITGTVTSGDTLKIPLDSGTTFTATATATATASTGSLSFSPALPSQVTSGAVIVDPANSLGQIKNAAFMAASTVRYFDGYFVFNANNARQFFLSSINDGTQYSGLDFATATAGSDNTVAIEVYHEQLLIFCEIHTEIWWNSGASSFPFQRYDAALIARGLAAPYATTSEDNTVFWMGEDGLFYRLNGFTPERISTFAMEHAWSQYPLKYLDCSCFTLDQEGHKFVVCNFPSGGQTWCYDIGSKLWHQRVSTGSPWV